MKPLASFIVFLFVATTLYADARVSVMTYNVENLFDTIDDPGNPFDDTYLPSAKKQHPDFRQRAVSIRRPDYRDAYLNLDWNEQVLKQKLANLARVIRYADANGPDLLALQEVENKSIVERLNRDFLDSSYRAIAHVESEDRRGIDVALLSHFPIVGQPHLHAIQLENGRTTRGILDVVVLIPARSGCKETKVRLLVVHFPSPAAHIRARLRALNVLNRLVSDQRSANGVKRDSRTAVMTIALGDFNITSKERGDRRIVQAIDRDWNDIEQLYHRQLNSKRSKRRARFGGSHFFERGSSWSFLDKMLQLKSNQEPSSDSLGRRWHLDIDSFEVIQRALYQSYRGRRQNREQTLTIQEWRPRAFDSLQAVGASDHWPLRVDYHCIPNT